MQIAILGAGVAGLSASIILARQGHQVDVYERHKGVSSLGAGIVCWPNATFVLSELGLLKQVLAVGGQVKALRRITQAGTVLGHLDITAVNKHMHHLSVSVFRSDLMTILHDCAQLCGVSIHFGRPAISIENKDGRGRILFESGPAVEADLIVGADGRMRSVARTYLLGNNAPVFQNFINWVGVFEGPIPLFESMAVCDYWGVGLRFGVVPISPTKAYWAGGAYVPVVEPQDPAWAWSRHAHRFSGWPGAISQIIEATDPRKVKPIFVHDHHPIGTWHRSNVLLIGDAAHASLPTSGQGACQALEDAWWLGKHLTNVGPRELDAALTAFTKRRIQKTRGITQAGRSLATSLFTTDPDEAAARDQRAQHTDYVSMASGMAHGWSADLPLAA